MNEKIYVAIADLDRVDLEEMIMDFIKHRDCPLIFTVGEANLLCNYLAGRIKGQIQGAKILKAIKEKLGEQ